MSNIHKNLSESARSILAQAEQEARALNHHYIGTEHILLGLVAGSGVAVDVLKAMGVDALRLRQEIEKAVLRGPGPVVAAELPLTPRAAQAIEFARDEANVVNQKSVDSEYLLIGLLREPDGVAGLVLRNLGVELKKVWEEVLKFRLLQMKIVEKAVRPIKANIARKRKMREELLAHLTDIYDQERARLQDPVAAIEAASQRFGDPAELSRELQRALPAHERIGHYLESWFAWRAPESAARYVFRQAVQVFLVILALCVMMAAVAITTIGWNHETWIALRLHAILLVLIPLDQFLLGVLYFKLRDTLWGAFGTRKSTFNVFCIASLIALVVLVSEQVFLAASAWDLSNAVDLFFPCFVAALVCAFAYLRLAHTRGPAQLADTLWAWLDIGT